MSEKIYDISCRSGMPAPEAAEPKARGTPEAETGQEGAKAPVMVVIPDEFATFQEEIMFNSEFRSTLRMLEKKLHTAEDTEFIIRMTVKTCCLFYDADWSGILIADRNTGVWEPKIWYDRAADGMAPTLFRENEFFEYFPHWVKALNDGEPVVLPDVEVIRDVSTEEYEGYSRLNARSVLGAPVGENPVGFLVVRNAKRYRTHPDMVQMLAFVGLSQYYLGEFLNRTPEEAADAKKVRINLFGVPSVVCRGTVISAKDYRAPKAWKLLAYLALSKKPRAVYEIAEALWPEEEGGDQSENVRSTVYRLRDRFAQKVPGDLIVNESGYRLNPALTVTTDAAEMERLWNAAQEETEVFTKVELLKAASRLYTGEVCEACADEEWLSPHVNYYATLYVKIVNSLLETLAGERDYPCIQEYAGRSLLLSPGNGTAYYWLAVALARNGAAEEARKRVRAAKETLIEEDYQALIARLKELRPEEF